VKKEGPRNLAASVRARLLNVAKARGEEFQHLLTRYGLERWLYRLSQSPHRDRFVLKGAMLFTVWGGEPHRATQDLDLLGYGAKDIPELERIFREVCAVEVEADGLEMLPETVHGHSIREDQEYEGVRIQLMAALGVARIPLQIDVGFGDAIIPAPEEAAFPTMLDFPAPRLRAYHRETVIAEKFQAMVDLGLGNSRLKDFHDIWTLAQEFEFAGATLAAAINATFARRKTPLPRVAPLALTAGFGGDPAKQTQWRAFLKKSRLGAGAVERSEVVRTLHEFLMPPTEALVAGSPFTRNWLPSGPWQPTDRKT
jgi:predicted nucleotidyltransferase component of viral defense system